MVLIPLLRKMTNLEENTIFPTCVTMILPMCITAIVITGMKEPLLWKEALPYLIGGSIGGCFAGKFGSRIPVSWLHKGLGIMILWGGIRNLC